MNPFLNSLGVSALSSLGGDDPKSAAMFIQLYKTMLNMNGNDNTDSNKPSAISNGIDKPMFDNILYSQLTKNSASSTPSPTDSMNNNEAKDCNNAKAQDLSQNKHDQNADKTAHNGNDRITPTKDIKVKMEKSDTSPENSRKTESSSPLDVVDCKVGIINVKNMLIKDVDNVCSSILSSESSSNVGGILDDLMCKANSAADAAAAAAARNSDDEAAADTSDDADDDGLTNGPLQAIEHGEQFLKWLESCSDPTITAMQVIQFKTLLNSCKATAIRAATQVHNGVGENGLSASAVDAEQRSRNRKRK